MEKLIVWFASQDKKIKLNQFHIEANDITEAIKEFEGAKTFPAKTMGVSKFRWAEETFKNKKFF